jgi:hypothetical protein
MAKLDVDFDGQGIARGTFKRALIVIRLVGLTREQLDTTDGVQLPLRACRPTGEILGTLSAASSIRRSPTGHRVFKSFIV